MKLTQDQKEDLFELTQADGWTVLLALIEDLVQLAERDVIRLNMNSNDTTRLLIQKARAEGARQLLASFQAETGKLQPKPSK